MELPIVLILRYFPESWKNFTAYATITNGLIPSVITDENTDRLNPSIFSKELEKIDCICHNIRWKYTNIIIPSVHFQRVIFFCVHFSSVKPSVFFTDRINDKGWNYQQTLYQRTHSITELVDKIVTDGMVISHGRKNSIGKTVKCFSELWSLHRCSPSSQVIGWVWPVMIKLSNGREIFFLKGTGWN